MKLYDYFRSSCAYRLRIALNLKGLEAERHFVNLRSGEQFSAEYKSLNPQASVPTLIDGSTTILQSIAALEYLEETHPEPAILPSHPAERAFVRSVALAVATDIHPVNNLRVLKYLTAELGVSEERKNDWYKHWIARGLTAIEHMLAERPASTFCCGESPTMADICLVPQVYNAKRFECPMEAYPHINRVVKACEALSAFERAAPENQPDAKL